jgi:hypothetical protein
MSNHFVILLHVFLSLNKKYKKKKSKTLVIEKSMAIEKGGDQNFDNK